MLKRVAFFYPCWLNDGKDLIYNEALVQNLYVGTKEDYKEFRTASLWAKNRKVTLVNMKLQCSNRIRCWEARNSYMWKAA